MTRVEALEAVADAVATLRRSAIGPARDRAHAAMIRAHDALRALPAAPEPARGKVVELAVWVMDNGFHSFAAPGSHSDNSRVREGWTRLGTVTLPLDVEGGA